VELKNIGDAYLKGFVCAYVKASETKILTRGYLATEADLGSFLKWLQKEGDVIVAIEGTHGVGKPIEKALREAGDWHCYREIRKRIRRA
jgi:hypothetical protein